MTGMEKAEELQRMAPPLRDCDRERFNKLFTAYIFRSKRQVWTTCCNKHFDFNENDCSDEEWELMTAPHCPEPKYRWYRCLNEYESSKRVLCPWCGKEAKLKELRYSGKRQNLWEYHRVILLRKWRGALWATAYIATKSYSYRDTNGPMLQPEVCGRLVGAYRFRPGEVKYATDSDSFYWYNGRLYYYNEIKSINIKKPTTARSPFGYCSEYGNDYSVVGWEELKKTDFKYIGIEQLANRFEDPLRLISFCCFEPRKAEMIHKAGFGWALQDLIEKKVQNAKLIRWDAEKQKDFLKLPISRIRELGSDCSPERVKMWIKLKFAPVEELDAACDINLVSCKMDEVMQRCRTLNIKYAKLRDYLRSQFRDSLSTAIDEWLDYMIAAEKLGLSLDNPIIQMPKDLRYQHDRRTHEVMEQAEQLKAKEYKKRYEKLQKKYAFSYAGMQIVIPRSAEDIVNEGKNLHHCVGGYASRHIDGSLAILFLRRAETPLRSLVTIEMHGNKIQQIHGWDDERSVCEENPTKISPFLIYQDFLDAWSDWLNRKSPRDKKGNPIISNKFKEAKSA